MQVKGDLRGYRIFRPAPKFLVLIITGSYLRIYEISCADRTDRVIPPPLGNVRCNVHALAAKNNIAGDSLRTDRRGGRVRLLKYTKIVRNLYYVILKMTDYYIAQIVVNQYLYINSRQGPGRFTLTCRTFT